jgi:hypothetical protein
VCRWGFFVGDTLADWLGIVVVMVRVWLAGSMFRIWLRWRGKFIGLHTKHLLFTFLWLDAIAAVFAMGRTQCHHCRNTERMLHHKTASCPFDDTIMVNCYETNSTTNWKRGRGRQRSSQLWSWRATNWILRIHRFWFRASGLWLNRSVRGRRGSVVFFCDVHYYLACIV